MTWTTDPLCKLCSFGQKKSRHQPTCTAWQVTTSLHDPLAARLAARDGTTARELCQQDPWRRPFTPVPKPTRSDAWHRHLLRFSEHQLSMSVSRGGRATDQTKRQSKNSSEPSPITGNCRRIRAGSQHHRCRQSYAFAHVLHQTGLMHDNA